MVCLCEAVPPAACGRRIAQHGFIAPNGMTALANRSSPVDRFMGTTKMKQKKCIVLLILALCVTSGYGVDAQLEKLQAFLDTASTQSQINLRSYDISQYLNKKLTDLEERIRKDLEPESKILFDKASVVWREYRAAQVDFESHFYQGGSMQPFVQNSVSIRITEERIAALSEVDPEGKYKESEPTITLESAPSSHSGNSKKTHQ